MREEDAQSRDNDDVNDKDSHDDRVKVVDSFFRVFAALACITSSICGEILQKLSLLRKLETSDHFKPLRRRRRRKTDARAVESVVRLVSP